MDHSQFDKRNYPIVDVTQGYGEWAATYEQVVEDEMDLRLLNRTKAVDWSAAQSVLDLACGTGRIGVWLRELTEAVIDGVDITAEMLARARDKGVYRQLIQASITDSGLPDGAYDLCVQSLADEHLPDMLPLYQETARLTKPGGHFVIVGFHPFFLMAGIPTHYDNADGQPTTIRSYVHLLSDHVKAAHVSGWSLRDMDEGRIDEAWLAKKPKWAQYRGLPVSYLMVWQKK